MPIRAMIDFETLGNGKHACVVQIGACFFSSEGIGSIFKAQIDAANAMRNGAEMDASTVYWWLAQSSEAIKSITAEPRMPEHTAFTQLNEFLAGVDEIWSHATFDFVILMEALKRLNIKPLFGYRAARDIRTLEALSPVSKEQFQRIGVHHDALDDAIFQAKYVTAMLRTVAPPAV